MAGQTVIEAKQSDNKRRWQCRDSIIDQLSALLSPSYPSPPTLVVHGPRATGKTDIVRALIKQSELPHVYMHCEEYITERHLLERTVAAITSTVQPHSNGHAKLARCETANALVTHLQELVGDTKFVLVFDGIDRQRDASALLLPALTRLGEVVRNLTTILIARDPPPNALSRHGIPHIHFEPYTKDQLLRILAQRPLDIFDPELGLNSRYTDIAHEEDKAWLWPRFCAAVWDSLAASAARDLESFRDLCDKLWQPFIEPILQGELGTRNISRLMVARRQIFQDETVLITRLVPEREAPDQSLSDLDKQQDLPYFAKWLLLAAFLASANPTRLDALYFMRSTEKKKRKKGGGGGGGAAAARSTNKSAQQRRLPRHLLASSTFTLDRLLSILHAILPDVLRTNIDIYTAITTLTSLRLMSKGSGLTPSDMLEPGTKWRIGPGVSWEFIAQLAASVDFQLTDYLAE